MPKSVVFYHNHNVKFKAVIVLNKQSRVFIIPLNSLVLLSIGVSKVIQITKENFKY